MGPFVQVFGEMRELLILELYEAIRVRQVVAYPIVIILFYDRDRQEGVFKVTKNDHFLVFLAVWVSFWPGEGAANIRIASNGESTAGSCVPNRFYFAF